MFSVLPTDSSKILACFRSEINIADNVIYITIFGLNIIIIVVVMPLLYIARI